MLQKTNAAKYDVTQIKNDVLSGLTVALALVPEAVAFAFIAGVDPVIGLYSAFFIGLITAIFGGRPGMISGATGAMAVVVIGLVSIHGIEYLFPTVILCGILQILVGSARLGKLIRMVPHPVMLGFVNGLAIVIFLAQFGSFKSFDPTTGTLKYLGGAQMGIMLGLVALTMLIIWGLPKLTKAFPSSLAAILIVTMLSIAINGSGSFQSTDTSGSGNTVATVGDMLFNNSKAKAVAKVATAGQGVASHAHAHAAEVELSETEIAAAVSTVDPTSASIKAGLPQLFFLNDSLPAMPPITWSTLVIIFPFALTLCGVGLIESLMTLTLIDEITETRGQGNRECFGQGLANIICGLFGGMGGCAMIGQSLINVNSGGRGRLSGIVAAVCLLLILRRSAIIGSRDAWTFAAIGTVIGMHWVLFFLSAKVSNVSVCMVAMATISLWTSLLEPMMLRGRRLRGLDVLFGVIVIGAVAFIFYSELRYSQGFLIGIGSAIAAAFFSILNGIYAPRFNHRVIALYEMIGAAMFCALAIPVWSWLPIDREPIDLRPTFFEGMLLLVLALVCIVYAYSEYVELLNRLSVFTVNFANNLEPVYGMLLGAIILGDHHHVGARFYIGAAVIVTAVASYPLLRRRFQVGIPIG